MQCPALECMLDISVRQSKHCGKRRYVVRDRSHELESLCQVVIRKVTSTANASRYGRLGGGERSDDP